MTSIINEIKKLRKDRPFIVDRNNKNRYRLVFSEPDGTHTAYYFNTPIYNDSKRNLLDLKFTTDGHNAAHIGSSSIITIGNGITLSSGDEFSHISMPSGITNSSENRIFCSSVEVLPTLNGVALKVPCNMTPYYDFNLSVNRPFMNIRANNKFFSYMKGEFTPFITVSCIGSLDGNGKIIAPCIIEYQKSDDYTTNLTVRATDSDAKYIMFEVNIHEQKIIRDTTVESNNPSINNVFGSTAFIGNTKAFGEQRLYWCIDCAYMSDILYRKINSVVLHLPSYTDTRFEIDAFKVSNRFCSFGSNWNNKIPETNITYEGIADKSYYNIDITELSVNKESGWIQMSNGIVIKSKKKLRGFTTVSTGDSCFNPQIIEINYK